MEDNEIPLAVYDCNQKKLAAVFRSISVMAKYCWPKESKQKEIGRIRYALRNKTKMKVDALAVAVRIAGKDQISLLGGSDMVILIELKPTPPAEPQ